jgi:hypothetical protein
LFWVFSLTPLCEIRFSSISSKSPWIYPQKLRQISSTQKAIAIALKGDDLSTNAYVGNQPGSFSPAFFLFLVGWAPFFLLAAYLICRFTKLRHT